MENNEDVGVGSVRSGRRRNCRTCGQQHQPHEPHLYDYIDDVDEDVTCHICLQPLVTPLDTPCGHTFCRPCLLSFLTVQQNCPVDRKPLSQQLCSPSSLVLKKLLEKLKVRCPNVDHCTMEMQRGDLEDHLKYRCPGNWVSCPHTTSGCDYRGSQRSITTHLTTCTYKDHGVSRPPIVEGEITHLEIPRTHTALGITIVGGSDTPLRCVVVQEVFPDGLVAQDGRLQPGDQIIEVDGVDMTSATHQVVCQALRRPQTVLRLGVYRERIEAQRTLSSTTPPAPPATTHVPQPGEAMMVTLQKESSRQLGLKLGGRRTEPGIFVMEVLEGSVAAQDGRLHPHDRILAINGADVRYARLDHASRLIQQSHTHVGLVVSRGPAVAFVSGSDTAAHSPEYTSFPTHHWRNNSAAESEFQGSTDHRSASDSGCGAMEYGRSASCDSLSDHSLVSSMMSSPSTRLPSETGGGVGSPSRGGSPATSSPGYCTSDTDDTESSHHHHHHQPPAHHHRHSTSIDTHHYNHQLPVDATHDQGLHEQHPPPIDHNLLHNSTSLPATPRGARSPDDSHDIVAGLKRLIHSENNQLHQKNVTIKKSVRESLGMRIGGGVTSNEGDTPIYIANINPQGPVGRCRNIKKGDVLLSVNGQSLLGLTHGQAVALLKATAELAGVTLSLLDGPETSVGSANFVPSWLYWQKLPRSLHISKSVVLHRAPGASLGFSIVGGSDPQRGAEPIHVLFVVQSSPAALEGKLRCGDRLLSVDGHSLELVRHASAVSLLKQAGQRVNLEVVSWLGTEL